MTPYDERGGITIFSGVCLEVLSTFETESVDLVARQESDSVRACRVVRPVQEREGGDRSSEDSRGG